MSREKEEKDRNMKEKVNLKSKTTRLKEIKKSSKGITLIALVITIIVLLILAGVSTAMLTGDNGILTQATESKKANTVGAEDEKALSKALVTILERNNYSVDAVYLKCFKL